MKITQVECHWALEAKGRGFQAAKLEITPMGPYAHKGCRHFLGIGCGLRTNYLYQYNQRSKIPPEKRQD